MQFLVSCLLVCLTEELQERLTQDRGRDGAGTVHLLPHSQQTGSSQFFFFILAFRTGHTREFEGTPTSLMLEKVPSATVYTMTWSHLNRHRKYFTRNSNTWFSSLYVYSCLRLCSCKHVYLCSYECLYVCVLGMCVYCLREYVFACVRVWRVCACMYVCACQYACACDLMMLFIRSEL